MENTIMLTVQLIDTFACADLATLCRSKSMPNEPSSLLAQSFRPSKSMPCSNAQLWTNSLCGMWELSLERHIVNPR